VGNPSRGRGETTANVGKGRLVKKGKIFVKGRKAFFSEIEMVDRPQTMSRGREGEGRW
jgi:hypothetical protein